MRETSLTCRLDGCKVSLADLDAIIRLVRAEVPGNPQISYGSGHTTYEEEDLPTLLDEIDEKLQLGNLQLLARNSSIESGGLSSKTIHIILSKFYIRVIVRGTDNTWTRGVFSELKERLLNIRSKWATVLRILTWVLVVLSVTATAVELTIAATAGPAFKGQIAFSIFIIWASLTLVPVVTVRYFTAQCLVRLKPKKSREGLMLSIAGLVIAAIAAGAAVIALFR